MQPSVDSVAGEILGGFDITFGKEMALRLPSTLQSSVWDGRVAHTYALVAEHGNGLPVMHSSELNQTRPVVAVSTLV